MKTKIKALLFVAISLCLASCSLPIEKDLRVYTTATITKPNVCRTGTYKNIQWLSYIDYATDSLHHFFNVVKVTEGSPVCNKMCYGEKFVMVYDKNKPNNYVVYIDKPLFLDNEPYIETIGTVLRVSPLVWDAGVEFSYLVKPTQINRLKKDSLFTKFQEVGSTIGEKSVRRQFPHLKKGNKYIVKYSPSNPQRAVIYL